MGLYVKSGVYAYALFCFLFFCFFVFFFLLKITYLYIHRYKKKVEGAANKDGRTPSIWDTYAHAGQCVLLFLVCFILHKIFYIKMLIHLGTSFILVIRVPVFLFLFHILKFGMNRSF